jgi:hypothetical protein
MEYLMTYGWSILIIAVALAALFSLGVFNSTNESPKGCVAMVGFYCQNYVFHNGVLTFTLGQSTGADWLTANVYFVPSGKLYNSSADPVQVLPGGLKDHQIADVSIAIPNAIATNTIGTFLQGDIYTRYTVAGGSDQYVTAAATISAAAT